MVSASGEFVFLLLRVARLFCFFAGNVLVVVSVAVRFCSSLLLCFACGRPCVVCAFFFLLCSRVKLLYMCSRS